MKSSPPREGAFPHPGLRTCVLAAWNAGPHVRPGASMCPGTIAFHIHYRSYFHKNPERRAKRALPQSRDEEIEVQTGK